MFVPLPAVWPQSLEPSQWQDVAGTFQHLKQSKKAASGKWKFKTKLPAEGWPVRYKEHTFWVNPTPFGHFGLFPEQAFQWEWLAQSVNESKTESLNILNLFGYTGASTLMVAAQGAQVTHLDASKTSVSWARSNFEHSGMQDKPVRWIVDDAVKFLNREKRRDRKYDGIIMDPPSFGRGPKGEVWKIENALPELMTCCRDILSDDPALILLTTHTPGFSGITLKNLIEQYLLAPGKDSCESGEMYIPCSNGPSLPNGFYARWKTS